MRIALAIFPAIGISAYLSSIKSSLFFILRIHILKTLEELRHISSFDRLFTTSTVPCVVLNDPHHVVPNFYLIVTTFGVLIAPFQSGFTFDGESEASMAI